MKGILINPHDKTVTEVEGAFDLQHMYDVLHCDTITALQLDPQNTLWLDDEGLLRDDIDQAYFYFGTAHQPFAGRGLVLGHTHGGDNASTTFKPDKIKALTTFIDKELVNPEDYRGWTITTWEGESK